MSLLFDSMLEFLHDNIDKFPPKTRFGWCYTIDKISIILQRNTIVYISRENDFIRIHTTTTYYNLPISINDYQVFDKVLSSVLSVINTPYYV